MNDLDTTDLERRLTTTLRTKAGQLEDAAVQFDAALTTPGAPPAPSNRRRLLVAAAVLLVAAAAAGLVFASGGHDSTTVPAQEVPVAHLEIDAMPSLRFDRVLYETKPGLNEIVFVSKGGTHTLAFAAPGLAAFRLTSSEGHPARGDVRLEAGRDYVVYCAVPGHRAAGMQAVIRVRGDAKAG